MAGKADFPSGRDLDRMAWHGDNSGLLRDYVGVGAMLDDVLNFVNGGLVHSIRSLIAGGEYIPFTLYETRQKWWRLYKHHHEVGMKEPNEWGIYDMIGNVGEMCESPGDRLICGGSFNSNPLNLAEHSVGARRKCEEHRPDETGFRIVLGPAEE
jgi:hypothetical protein